MAGEVGENGVDGHWWSFEGLAFNPKMRVLKARDIALRFRAQGRKSVRESTGLSQRTQC